MNRAKQSDFFDTESQPDSEDSRNGKRIAMFLLPLLALIPISVVFLSDCSGGGSKDAGTGISPLALEPTSADPEGTDPYEQQAGYRDGDGSGTLPPEELLESSAAAASGENPDGTENSEPKLTAITEENPAGDNPANSSASSASAGAPNASGATDPSKSDSHQVGPGETLYSIGKQHGRSPESIAQANGMGVNDVIREGETLRIPSAQDSTAASTNVPPPTQLQPSAALADSTGGGPPGSHTVQPGDTLYSIGNRYNRTPEDIARENQIGVNDPIAGLPPSMALEGITLAGMALPAESS